jgi:hypothetical protein
MTKDAQLASHPVRQMAIARIQYIILSTEQGVNERQTFDHGRTEGKKELDYNRRFRAGKNGFGQTLNPSITTFRPEPATTTKALFRWLKYTTNLIRF